MSVSGQRVRLERAALFDLLPLPEGRRFLRVSCIRTIRVVVRNLFDPLLDQCSEDAEREVWNVLPDLRPP